MRKKLLVWKALPLLLAVALLFTSTFPKEAKAWGALVGAATHQFIDKEAHFLLRSDPAFDGSGFPSLDDIKDHEGVNWFGIAGVFGGLDQFMSGPGPDSEGSTYYSEHYYNPRTGQGRAPSSVAKYYRYLAKGILEGKKTAAAHAAAWAAHFLADMHVPYHVNGATREWVKTHMRQLTLSEEITGPAFLAGPYRPDDFTDEVDRYLSYGADKDHVDWFDPWYWNGVWPAYIKISSHIFYEGTLSHPSSYGLFGYDPNWKNAVPPTFSDPWSAQARQAEAFAKAAAQRTVDNLESYYRVPGRAINLSIRSVYTLWRASISALRPDIWLVVPDPTDPQKFGVQAIVENVEDTESAQDVQVKITVTGGTLYGSNIRKIDSVSAEGIGFTAPAWEVETSDPSRCKIKLEVIGSYTETPDLQYAVVEKTLGDFVTPEIPTRTPTPTATPTETPTLTPTPGTPTPTLTPGTPTVGPVTASRLFSIDNSGSMSENGKIEAAKRAAHSALNALSADTEVALQFFGVTGCDVSMVQDFTLDHAAVHRRIDEAVANGMTPLAAAIRQAGAYMRKNAHSNNRDIILLTDGMETCQGDPIGAAKGLNSPASSTSMRRQPSSMLMSIIHALANAMTSLQRPQAQEPPIRLHVIGFGITDPSVEQQLKEIAKAGMGQYYSAGDQAELTKALTQAATVSLTLGDGNGDGLCTEVDALMALRMAVGLQAPDAKMDVNGDGQVTEVDALQILKWAVAGGQCGGASAQPTP